MGPVEDKARHRLAWVISIFLHILLFFFLGVGRAPGGTAGIRVLAVGWVELEDEGPASSASAPGVVVPSGREAPVLPPLEPVKTPLLRPREGKSTRTGPTQVAPSPKGEDAGTVTSPPPAGDGRTAGGSGPGVDFGTGEGLVVSAPLSYPKNAQNEGVEGTTRLFVFLSPTGRPRAELVASSGDGRLDAYALRAVSEAWRYDRPPVPLRLEIEVVFAQGEARPRFLGATPLPEEGGP